MRTIRDLVGAVHETVTTEGMDLSPSDVGHIVALFLEGIVHNEPKTGIEDVLQQIADECESVRDE